MSHEEYWLKKLSGNIEKKSFPFDHNAPVMNERRTECLNDILAGDIFTGLLELSKGDYLQLYKILVAGVVLLLHKYTGDGDGIIIVGGPICREKLEVVNTVLAMKNSIIKSFTFKEFFLQVSQTIDEAYKHEDYPMEVLLWQLNLLSAEDEFPLFDVTISLENLHDKSCLQYINTNIKFSFLATDREINATIEYNASLYEKVTIKRILHHLVKLLHSSLLMDIPLIEIDILSAKDKRQLLFDFNDTKSDYPQNKTIHDIFVEQTEKGPDCTAVIYQDTCLSYKELDRKSNLIAAFLQAKRIIRDEPIGIMATRSLEMVIGLLAILKAGGIYLPINLDYPQDRKEYILENAHIRLLFTNSKSFVYAGALEIISLESANIYEYGDQLVKSNGEDDGAYIMFTSGSSGKPKGVIVEHRGVVRLVKNTNYLIFNKSDRILQTGALEFDASTFEIWGSLLNGLTLCLAHNDDILIPENLKKTFLKYDVDMILMTTSLFNQMSDVDSSIFYSLNSLLIGGEALSPVHINHVRSICPQLRLINVYGPTENTTLSTFFTIDKNYEENIPIGRPIANSTCYIMDDNLCLLPLGVPGELIVGGDGVGRGYLNAPELTAEKFIDFHHPSLNTHHLKLYRTGDLARYLFDGKIEFLGRIDQQVKIRGFRIEPGEIENRLLTIDSIKEAVVVDLKDNSGEKYLCAYMTAVEKLNMSIIRKELSKLLPEFMIPSYLIQLEKIPLNLNGKIDRKKLPNPIKNQRSHDYTSPRNEIENKLTSNWADVLHMNQNLIGIDDDFFKLGGHSLKAAVLVAAIHKTFHVKLLLRQIFDLTTVRKQAEYIKQAEKVQYSSIQPAPVKQYYRLSSAQKRMYFMTQLDKNSTLYNEQLMELYQKLTDKERLENAFKKMIARHESLRTSFHQVDGEAVQKIHSIEEVAAEFEIEYYESAEDGAIFSPQEGKEWTRVTGLPFQDIVEQFVQPFDLSIPPLLRVGLIKIMETHQVLMLDIQHIIFDGLSLVILLEELWKLYDGEELAPLTIQYKDFAEWSHSDASKKEIEEQEKFWLKEFSGEIPQLNLPIDYPRPSKMTFEGDTLTSEINTERIQNIYRVAQISGTTLFMVLLAVYNILLSKLSGQEEIIIGTVTAGRSHADLQKIIGMFVNMLALRNFPFAPKKFKEFLIELKEKTLAAFENQDYQFEQLVSKIAPRHDSNRNPLFDSAFELENESDHKEYLLEALMLNKANPYDFKVKKAKFELSLIAVESHEGLLLKLEYNTQLFKKETAERFLVYYKKLLISICSNVEQVIARIEMIPEKERRKLLYKFNNTEWDFPQNMSIHSLFEERVSLNPDNIAIVGITYNIGPELDNSGCWVHTTYRELNKKANQIAQHLIASSFKSENIAAIMIEPSQEMFSGLFAILKAGGAFLPIKDGTPIDRLKYILQESSASFLLTNRALAKGLSFEGKIICLNNADLYFNMSANPAVINKPNDIAYLIYTSGSTGKPKGVVIEHHGLSNLCTWHNKYYSITERDHVTKYAGFGFDASIWEIFPNLLEGATIYIVPEKIKLDITALNHFYEMNGITVSFLPTQVAEQFATLPNTSLRLLQAAGDKLKKFIKRNYKLYNCYGPTENTICTTSYHVTQFSDNIPIGKPIFNNKIYILDRNNYLQPIGVPGELYIGGDGLARGYLNQPELTAEKFIHFHHSSFKIQNSKLYRTGDLARWQDDGNIEFLGRIDSQVKIRGFRIELGEIENRLLLCKDIKETVVLAREDNAGQKYLCAYIVAEGIINIEAIKISLLKNLPDYMLPQHFIQLENIPLTANGKIDIRALPTPEVMIKPTYEAPTNEVEEILAQTWAEALGIQKVGITANFFEMGGDSIKTIIIAARLLTRQLSINIKDIFVFPTIKELAINVKRVNRTIAQAIVTGKVTLTPIQYWFFENHLPYSNHFNQSILLSRGKGFNENFIKKVMTKIISHHDALRMIYKIENGAVIQENRGNDGKLFDLECIQLKSIDGEAELNIIKKEANRIQMSINLRTGPLVKLGLFKGLNGDYLLMVIHHLVIDAISWHILLEDFDLGYYQIEQGETIKFQEKTHSFKYWTCKLGEYSKEKKLLKEIPYWKSIEALEMKKLPVDYEIQVEQRTFQNNSQCTFAQTKTSIDAYTSKIPLKK
ncbi:MAG: amino acid adenylation domain-containing protein [Acidobacteria bacterium]|nr:amino acid adenylation domain-containing protein [Acidobacteriota bacterium]